MDGWISGKATEIILNIHEFDNSAVIKDLQHLVWLLLDLGPHRERLLQSHSVCLRSNKQHHHPQLNRSVPPKDLLRKLPDATEDVRASLSQCGVGQWAGDRLILIGDEGKAMIDGIDYEMAMDFPPVHVPKLNSHSFNKLKKLCDEKDYKVVNLDKKEYLDPLAYGLVSHSQPWLRRTTYEPGESDVLQYASRMAYRAWEERDWKDVMTGLIITLFYSSITSIADLRPSAATSLGMWAGNRITVCTP